MTNAVEVEMLELCRLIQTSKKRQDSATSQITFSTIDSQLTGEQIKTVESYSSRHFRRAIRRC